MSNGAETSRSEVVACRLPAGRVSGRPRGGDFCAGGIGRGFVGCAVGCVAAGAVVAGRPPGAGTLGRVVGRVVVSRSGPGARVAGCVAGGGVVR